VDFVVSDPGLGLHRPSLHWRGERREHDRDRRADTHADEYRRLRASAGWNELSPDGIRAGLSGSLYSVVLERDGEAVGCGRVVGDGGIYFYVQDVIVVSELRGLGWGARIMDAVMRYLDASVRPGSFIGLMAAKDAEGFYRRYGFDRRPDDRPGMFRTR
jgi:ribosomal protein S18 acetylase RimI-like enzyme